MLQALEAVNAQLRELYPDSEELFDIVLMTNNHAQVGVRLINSINHYGEMGTKLPFGGFWVLSLPGTKKRRCFPPFFPPSPRFSPRFSGC